MSTEAARTLDQCSTYEVWNWDFACCVTLPSQRSLHDAPIFRLLLKVAVNGTHQCDFPNFCGAVKLQPWELYGSHLHPSGSWNHSAPTVANLLGKHPLMVFVPWQCVRAYLLGLLAMIKCSICSCQCDNWYVSNWRLACHIYFWLGKSSLELARRASHVALALHKAGSSIPLGVTMLDTHTAQHNKRHSWSMCVGPKV